MKNFSFASMVFLTFVYVILVYSCKENSKDKQDTITIGAILPLTGKYADLGNSAKVGMMLAVEELNKADSNFSFNILIEDGKSEASVALNAYNKLVKQEKVDILLTISSAFSLSLKPQAIKDSILLFCIASHPAITERDHRLIFRPCNTSAEECSAITSYINSNVDSSKKSWVFYHNSEFGNSFKDQISKQMGERIAGYSPYDDKPETFKSLAIASKGKRPDNIIAIGFTPSLGLLIKTIRESDFHGEIFSNIGFSSTSSIAAAGDAAKGINYVEYDLPYNDPNFLRIDSLSIAEYNTKFSSMSFLSYSSIKIINHAALESKSTKIYNIANYLRRARRFNIDGITLQSDEIGNIQPSLYMKKYE